MPAADFGCLSGPPGLPVGFLLLRYSVLFKKQIPTLSDLLLIISLAGGQSLKWINQEREARMIYSLTTDRQKVIY